IELFTVVLPSGVVVKPDSAGFWSSGMLVPAATAVTPAMPRRAARSRGMSLAACLGSVPFTVITEMPCSSIAFGQWMSAMRWPIMNTALHSTAQASAISSTIRVAGMRCLRRLASIGRISMLISSTRFQLRSRRYHAGAPCRQQAGCQRHHEGEREHRQVQVREAGVLRRLMADAPQPQLGEDEAQHAAGHAHDGGLDHELGEDRTARGAQRAAHANLARAA